MVGCKVGKQVPHWAMASLPDLSSEELVKTLLLPMLNGAACADHMCELKDLIMFLSLFFFLFSLWCGLSVAR